MNPILFSARPLENHNYKIYDTLGIKLLKRLRLNFSCLKRRKFGHNLQTQQIDSLMLCCRSLETKTTLHFFYLAETTPFTSQLL